MFFDNRAELRLIDLAFLRNYRWLFQNIHATLSAGDILLIQGANGSGKSTLLRVLAGYMEPAKGEIFWGEKNISAARHDYQQQLHYLGHQNGLKPALTVMENLRLTVALAGKKFSEVLAKNVLEELQIAQFAEQMVMRLSAGQSRRVALARLLLNPSQIWLLDEPSTALDVKSQDVLAKLMKQHCEHGGMVVVATHQELGIVSGVKKINL